MKIIRINNLYKGSDIFSKPKPSTHWLVEKRIPYGSLSALVGESGTGKSTLLSQLAISIIKRERTFLGYNLITRSKKVLYVSTEDGLSFTHERLSKQLGYSEDMFSTDGILIKKDPYLSNIWFLFDNKDVIDSITQLLETESIDLVIVDAYSDVFEEDMNHANKVRQFLTEYGKLADQYGCAILFMHHYGKGDRTKAKHKILGSAGFEQKMRSILSLDRKDDQSFLKTIKNNYLSHDEGNSADHLLLGDDLLFTKIGSFDSGAERAPKRTKLDIVMEDHREVLIEVQNGNLSYKDAIELLLELGISVSDGTIGRALKRLEQQQ
jgi:predicted ATP-dependent serine protease